VDTTSSAAIGILYCLAKNQEKQDKLRAELLQILPNKDDELTPVKMQNMPYLRAVIKEGIRLYPPTAGTMRSAGEDLVLSGYQVPKGTDIVLNLMMANTDESLFPCAHMFIPERWLKDKESKCPNALSPVNPFAYLPFGFGPRMCIGNVLWHLNCLIEM
jgi:cytochrome P450 family 12